MITFAYWAARSGRELIVGPDVEQDVCVEQHLTELSERLDGSDVALVHLPARENRARPRRADGCRGRSRHIA